MQEEIATRPSHAPQRGIGSRRWLRTGVDLLGPFLAERCPPPATAAAVAARNQVQLAIPDRASTMAPMTPRLKILSGESPVQYQLDRLVPSLRLFPLLLYTLLQPSATSIPGSSPKEWASFERSASLVRHSSPPTLIPLPHHIITLVFYLLFFCGYTGAVIVFVVAVAGR